MGRTTLAFLVVLAGCRGSVVDDAPRPPTGEGTGVGAMGRTGDYKSSDVLAGSLGSVAPRDEAFAVSGVVTGLAGSGLVLQNNGDALPVASNGAFRFAQPVPSGHGYSVTVASQPSSPAQTCTVGNGTGTMAGGDVSSVTITCATHTHLVGGNVNGLTGTGLVLQLGGDELAISGAGVFAFPTPIAVGQPYDVEVKTQPADQTCLVRSGSGTVGDGDVTTVEVTCRTIANASFESGDYSGWTLSIDQVEAGCGTWGIIGSGQTIHRNDTLLDYYTHESFLESSRGLPVTWSASDGNQLAVALQNCAAEQRASQTLHIPAKATQLSWDMTYANWNASFDPASQYLAITLRDPGTGAVLATIYKTTDGVDPQSVPMKSFSAPVTAFQGQTVQLSVELRVELSFLDAAFDNFRLQ